jgi:hypothetical protein
MKSETLVFVGVLGVLFVELFVMFWLEYWRKFKDWEAGADLTGASKAEIVSKKRAVALKDISKDMQEFYIQGLEWEFGL